MSDADNSTFEGACDSCGMKLELAREYIGKKVQCPGCSNKFIVADPDAPAVEEAAAPPVDPTPSSDPTPPVEEKAPVEDKAPAVEEKAARRKENKGGRTMKKAPVKRETRKGTSYKKANSSSRAVSAEESPDALMSHFEGPGFKPIIVFTIAVHAVLLLGTSVPFFISKFTAEDMAEKPKDERLDEAVGEATKSIREIAKHYEVNPQELSDRFQKGKRKAPPTEEADPQPVIETPGPDTPGPDGQPTNAIERELNVSEKGPEIPGNVEEDDDLF